MLPLISRLIRDLKKSRRGLEVLSIGHKNSIKPSRMTVRRYYWWTFLGGCRDLCYFWAILNPSTLSVRMNYTLTQIPERVAKPRQSGLTMVMDKGLSLREVEDFLSTSAEYADIIKLGWATSFVTPNLKQKIALYQDAGIPVYFGGTLFEAFVVRNQFDDYRRMLDEFKLRYAEVSDGSIDMKQDDKCEYIRHAGDRALGSWF